MANRLTEPRSGVYSHVSRETLTPNVGVRHEVALVDCPAVPRETDRTRRFPAGTLRWRAAVALMTGCGAHWTMYRSRRPPRGDGGVRSVRGSPS